MIRRFLRSLANPEADPPAWSLGFGVMTIVLALAATILGSLIVVNLLGDTPVAWLAGWTLGSVVTASFVWSSTRRNRETLRSGPTNARLFLVLLFSVGLALLIDTVVLAITREFYPAPELLNLLFVTPGIGDWLLAALFMLVAQPIAEELVFRGVFFPAARHALGGWGGLLASALAYAMFHLLAYTSAPSVNIWHTFVTPLLIGLVIGAMRANTRSTRVAILAHMGFNLFALLKLLIVPV
jgi:membrane protease YdiL (CAAX protease family)